MVALELVGVGLTFLLGLMPIYLMLARMSRSIGRLSADHKRVEEKVDRVQRAVDDNDTAIDRLSPGDD